jgi:hypothetical protein
MQGYGIPQRPLTCDSLREQLKQQTVSMKHAMFVKTKLVQLQDLLQQMDADDKAILNAILARHR